MKPVDSSRLGHYAYSTLLRFYPASFRREFAAEMREVFNQASADAAGRGLLALASLWLNELLNLPAALLQVHWRAYRSARLQAQSAPIADDASIQELLLALLVFLLPAGMLLSLSISASINASLSITLLFLGVMLSIGRLRGAPLWSLPYLGVMTVVAAYLYLFQWVVSLVSPSLIANFAGGPWDRSTYLLLRALSTGMLWLMLFCLTLLVIALLALLNRFQPLFCHLRRDWTLLSYILYGESVFALLLLFRDYRQEATYLIASLLCLFIGAWFYLRAPLTRLRIFALLASLTLAMGLIALEQGFVLPASGASLNRFLFTWLWMVLALLLPRWLARWDASRRDASRRDASRRELPSASSAGGMAIS